MTDNDIIKALERQAKNMLDGYQTYLAHGGKRDEELEQDVDSWSAATNLINRQNAWIDRLEKECEEAWEAHSKQIEEYDKLFEEARTLIKRSRTEAIKVFAERLKEELACTFGCPITDTLRIIIDNLVKEMVGERE